MKRKIACYAFWCLLFLTLFIVSTIIGAIFASSSDVDAASMIVLFVIGIIFASLLVLCYRFYAPLKEKYYLIDETPLVFHKVFCNILLPIGAIYDIVSIFNIIVTFANPFYFIDLIYRCAALVLKYFCFMELRKWKPRAWRLLLITLLAGRLYELVVVIISILFSHYLVGSNLSSLMVGIYFSAIIVLYYYKRRVLFFDTGDFSPREIQFCEKCGSVLDIDAQYCKNCGSKVGTHI